MLIINELRFCLRQPVILVSLILLPLFALMLSIGASASADIDPVIQLHFSQTTLLMLLLPILVAVITPIIFLRDSSSNMSELIGSTPVTYTHRWLLRFGTTVALFFALFIVSYLLLFFVFLSEFNSSTELLVLTLTNLIMLVLPSILITSAFALWLSIFWQSAMVIYASTAAFGVIYLMLSSMTGSPVLAGSRVVSESFYNTMIWLDPFGITASVHNITTSNALINDQLLVNRIVYLLLSAVFVYLVLRKKTQLSSAQNRSKQTAISKKKSTSTKAKSKTNRLPQTPFMQLIKVPFFTLLHSRTTQVIFLIWPMVIFNEVLSGIGQAEPLSMYSANSIDALNFVAFDVFSVFGAFVVALWSWFICSRDKSFNIAELVAAAPISNRQIIGGQIIALGLLISVLVVLTFIGSSLAELAAGSDWLFSHYIVQLGLTALPLFLLGTLFICIHHLCRSSAVAGGLVIVILLVKFSAIMTALGLTHTLWNIAGSPIQEPDNFWGYRASLSVYLPYMSVWLIAATSMVLLASNRSHRGTSLGKLSLTGLPKHVLSSFVVTTIAGLGLHFALVSEKPLTNSDKRETWKAQYETQFGNWQHKAQPSIVHIDSNVDIFPEQQFAKFSLSYTLENRTTSPINKILVGRYGNYAFGSYSIKQQDQKDATLIEFNSALNQGVFQLSRTLMPGEQTTMQTEFTYEQSQLWPHRSHQVVTPEFSYLRATPLLPTVGFQTEYLLTNAQIRDHYNLPQLEAQAPSKQFDNDNSHTGKYNWASLNTVISTQLNHQPISQGTLVRSWQQNQRTFVHYQTKHPVNAIPTWLSVPFTALSKTVQGTTLNVYSPNKNQASEVNLKAMADTMAWLNQNVSPYTGAQLNLIAAPDIGAHSFSVPHIMLLNHTIGFRAKPTADAEFDQRYRRMVSETARQWFAHDLGNGVNNERSFFVESMPKYIELVMIEKQFGAKAMLALVEYEQNRFNLGQTNNYQNPVALIDATQKFDIESRATLAFAKLREILGDEPIIAALKSLWLHHAYPQTPATSMDFIRALQRHSPKTHHTLINELFLSPMKGANH